MERRPKDRSSRAALFDGFISVHAQIPSASAPQNSSHHHLNPNLRTLPWPSAPKAAAKAGGLIGMIDRTWEDGEIPSRTRRCNGHFWFALSMPLSPVCCGDGKAKANRPKPEDLPLGCVVWQRRRAIFRFVLAFMGRPGKATCSDSFAASGVANQHSTVRQSPPKNPTAREQSIYVSAPTRIGRGERHPMRALAIGSLVGSLSAALFLPSTSNASPYAPPPGYGRTPESFQGDVFAVAPDGKVAIGFQSSSAVPDPIIRVYANAAAAQANAAPVQTFTPAGAQFYGDLTFADNNTLLMSEDSGINGVLSGSMTDGSVTLLGNVPAVQCVAVHNGNVYAVAANGPGANAVYQVGNNTPILSNIGNGYLGGIAFDSAGRMLLSDSNDSGPAGQIIRYDPTLTTATDIDLSGGNGFGAFDVALDTEGDIFATTGNTITEVPIATGIAQQFGSGFSDSPVFGFTFLTGLDFSGTGFTTASDTGRLWINAVDSEDSAIIGVQTPEPSGALLLVIAATALLTRRRLAATAKRCVKATATRRSNRSNTRHVALRLRGCIVRAEKRPCRPILRHSSHLNNSRNSPRKFQRPNPSPGWTTRRRHRLRLH